MTASILVDGVAASTVTVLDRGLAFGDGIFRTLEVRAGRALNWDRHFRRLAHDCQALDIPVPDEAVLRSEIARVAPREAVVKITVTRGTSGRGYSKPTETVARRIVAAFDPPEYPAELARDGIRVRRCDLVLSEQPRLAGVKTLNRLENVLARSEWFDASIREGLLCDREGRLVEATMSNVFLVVAGALVTPLLTRCGVAGAQRDRVRDLAAAGGITCDVRDVAFAELEEADEVFLANSLIGLWPVVALGEKKWPVGSLTRRFQSEIAADDAKA
ncbi:Aminodeoxychorismate lyase [Usitatibacter rugosus]|uniref:aminodeoxychorismate lyase n=1 Tax=Usitatibacter rugosus TaxID=2732067 RepID=A0A6M4GVR3_9PROT|nr:aminodeoxychorismate lyase [Usitatibacter rugosus]QJR11122.1 Aminodeoxychorismate lyase [Usitatibacter rugosus]